MKIFKKLMLSALVSVGLSAPAAADIKPTYVDVDGTVHVLLDFGGDVEAYKQQAQEWKDQGRKVVIDGMCYSACTIFLWESFGLDVCITPYARLGFHKPGFKDVASSGKTESELIANSEFLWQYEWLPNYPEPLRLYLADNTIPSLAAHDKGLLTIPPRAAGVLLKTCE